MEKSPHNIFNLPHPEQWWCKVESYTQTHGVLRLNMIRSNDDPNQPFSEILRVEFRKVVYFSGWLSWQGANLNVMSDEFKNQFLQRHNGSANSQTDTMLYDAYSLFEFEMNSDAKIHLLANAVRSVSEENKTAIQIWPRQD